MGAALRMACRKNLVSREACSIRASVSHVPAWQALPIDPGCDSNRCLAGCIDQEQQCYYEALRRSLKVQWLKTAKVNCSFRLCV